MVLNEMADLGAAVRGGQVGIVEGRFLPQTAGGAYVHVRSATQTSGQGSSGVLGINASCFPSSPIAIPIWRSAANAVSADGFLGDQDPGQFTPRTMRFAIWVNTYDCAKQLRHPELSELHIVDGTIRSDNRPSSKWYPALIPAADPVFGYVCEWKGE
jgi:hypothetical protein